MSDKRHEFLSGAAGRYRKTGTNIANIYGLGPGDFSGFKVTDGEEPCCLCDVANHPSAPVLIQGKHYCEWCALEIARELLTTP